MADTQDDNNNSQKAPYEDVLLEGIKKLDSQIFIFLLLYVIVLSGMAGFFSDIPLSLQLSLILIPFFGIVAFMLSRRNKVSKQMANNIRVRVGNISEKAQIIGRQGNQIDTNIDVSVKDASGESLVIGSSAPTMPQQSESELETLLLEEFGKLSTEEKFEFIQRLKQR